MSGMTTALTRLRSQAFKRYDRASQSLVSAEERVRQASHAKALALLDAHEAGLKLSEIAERVGLSAQRVHQLVQLGRSVRESREEAS